MDSPTVLSNLSINGKNNSGQAECGGGQAGSKAALVWEPFLYAGEQWGISKAGAGTGNETIGQEKAVDRGAGRQKRRCQDTPTEQAHAGNSYWLEPNPVLDHVVCQIARAETEQHERCD